MEKVRLQKIIASAGLALSRAAEIMILDERVKLNGVIVSEPGIKADPEKDIIEVDGKPLSKMEKNVY